MASDGIIIVHDDGASVETILVASTTRLVVTESERQVVVLQIPGMQGGQGDPGADGADGADGATGPAGPRGPSGGTTTIYDQVLPSAHWDVVHNLGQYPSVDVVDSSGAVIIGAVTYVSTNELQIDFTAAMAGQAFLN